MNDFVKAVTFNSPDFIPVSASIQTADFAIKFSGYNSVSARVFDGKRNAAAIIIKMINFLIFINFNLIFQN